MTSLSADANLLLADIGGTNARFAIATSAAGISQVEILPTPQLGAGEDFSEKVAQLFPEVVFAAGAIAIAGPVSAGSGRITNGTLALDEQPLSLQLKCPIFVRNDFYALAHGVPDFQHLLQLGGQPTSGSNEVRAVIGAGSGLGMSALVPQTPRIESGATDFLVLPSEGGYADLACSNDLEVTVLQMLEQRFNHVCWETVLSGPGLVNLYQALAQLWGVEPEEVTPQWISEQGVEADVPLCHQTLELFFSFLGTAAGNLALTLLSRGGVYIAGGIVPQLADFAQASSLRRRFEERGELTSWAQQVPIYIVQDAHPGLVGAQSFLARQFT